MKTKRKEYRGYIATLLFTLLAMVFMVSFSYSIFYRDAKDKVLAQGEVCLARQTGELNGYITRGLDVLKATAISVEFMMEDGASGDAIEALLTEESVRYAQDIDENFTGLYGLINGEYLDSSDWVPEAGYVPQERAWYTDALAAGGETAIVAPYVDAYTHEVMISLCQLLYDGESVISLDLRMDSVQAIARSIRLDGMGYGFVMDRSGLVVAHSDPGETGKNYTLEPSMAALSQQILAGTTEISDITVEGEACVAFIQQSVNGWYVVMIVSSTRLFESIRSILMHNILVSAVVFALVMFFCTRAFRKMRWHMRRAQESREAVEHLSASLMRIMAMTIDAKDRYTNGHSLRVAGYAAEIARRMGKDETQQQEIYNAALLHDVGKIRIPDSIISKPEKLTDEEYAYMKLHSTAGYYILREIGDHRMIAEGSRWHHERFDGSGYPNALRAENIPEVARIIGVADAYDAMTSKRSYRGVLPQDHVRREIEKGRGVQFDPAIADILLSMIDEDRDYTMREQDVTVKNILVIDDDRENLAQLQAALTEENGYRLFIFPSGAEGIAALQALSPELLLLSARMAAEDGIAVYEAIRKVSRVPVLFMTARNDRQSTERVRHIRDAEYIVKPFPLPNLLEVVHDILQGKATGAPGKEPGTDRPASGTPAPRSRKRKSGGHPAN